MDITRNIQRRSLVPALAGAGMLVPLGVGTNYVMNVLLGRVLSVEQYGLFAYAQALATILALGASLGFSSSMMRFVPAYRAQNNMSLLRGLVEVVPVLVGGATLVIASVLVVWMWIAAGNRDGILWAVAMLPFFAFSACRESAQRGLHQTAAAILPRQIILPVFTIVGVFLFGARSAFMVLAIHTVALFISELWGGISLGRKLWFLKSVQPERQIRKWLSISVPMGLSALANLGINRWDIVILAFVVGVDAAGTYAAAARTALLASLVLRIVTLVVGPMLAELYHKGERRRFRRLLLVAAGGSGIVGLPLYLLVMLYPQSVLSLFGSEYSDATLLLQILATGQFVNLITGPAGLALTMSKHESLNLVLTLGAAIVSIVGLVFLSPSYGAVGVAIVTASAISILNLAQVIACVTFFGRLH